jgi:RHS repeat-associated protein
VSVRRRASGRVHYNDFRDYDSSIGGYVESDPIGLAGGQNTYSYAGAAPLSTIDPLGLDWLEYEGQTAIYYGGNLGDRSHPTRWCAATSGMSFSPDDQALEGGPVPSGLYSINLRLDPSRFAQANRANGEIYSGHGIQRIPDETARTDGGTTIYPGWGTWRMRLDPKRADTFGRSNFYLHNSHKGYTHGCIESCNDFLRDILAYRGKGNPTIDVLVRYTAPKTRGRTKW